MCWQTALRFSVSLRLTLSNSITFTVTNEYGKGAVIEIESILARLPRFLSTGPLKRDFLGIYLTVSFTVRDFGDT